MKKTTTFFALLVAGTIGLSGTVVSGEKEAKLPSELAEFTLTGETRKCIQTSNILSSEPWDDRHMIFRLRNGDYYLNRLGRGCVGLGFEKTYSYRNRIAELCANEIITVVDTFTQSTRGSCGLSEFEKLAPKASAEKADGA